MPDIEFGGLLALPQVRQCLWEAWLDSQPDDPADRHEEGGYCVRNDDGGIGCERWPRGDKDRITPPDLVNNRHQGLLVIGEFHIHPHPLPYFQDPSERDLKAIARQSDEAKDYVISSGTIYHIEPNGLTPDLPLRASALSRVVE